MAAKSKSKQSAASSASAPSDATPGSSSTTTSTVNATTPKQKQQTKKKSFLSNIFSLSTLSTLVAIFYVKFAFTNLLNLMYPLRNVPSDVIENAGNDRMVFPLWSWGDETKKKDDGGGVELGLRVYLSNERDFSLDYFSRNDEFDAIISSGTDGNGVRDHEEEEKVIRDGNSFLLWSEDNALDATTKFPSRSFILAASDDGSCIADGGQTCSSADDSDAHTAHQTSVEFANQWLTDSIQHEKQLQSDGGGLMAAMNSAGSGIESTSVLLTFYTSIHGNVKHLLESVVSSISSLGGGDEGEGATTTPKQSTQVDQLEEDEPRTVIQISPSNPLWKSLMSNGTAYVHVLLFRQTPPPLSSSPDAQTAARQLQQLHSQHNVLFGRVGMMKRELPLHVPSPKRLLYRDVLFVLQKYLLCPINVNNSDGKCNNIIPPWNVAHHQPKSHTEYQQARLHKSSGVVYPYWKPEVRIHLIQETIGYPIDYVNRIGFDIVQVGRGRGSGYAYLPAVHVDEIGLTSDKYIPLNETVHALPLRIGFHSGMMSSAASNEDGDEQADEGAGLTPARYRLLNHLSSALESQAEMGFEQSDIDDLRRLIAETNVMLLAITILASVLHLLFEFLTFKSDVDFWRSNTDLTGLSVRALFLDWIGQVVILLYLIELDSSLLMTVPSGVGMLIALWKCQRGAGLKFVKSTTTGKSETKAFYNRVFGIVGYELCATRLRAATASSTSGENKSSSSSNKPDLAALTEEMDQLATQLLGKYFLLPLVVSYAIYSLVKEHHSGWYSWFITTASSFVYAIGFVLMTPQLFLNYKLKSVAHLPWRVLGYRFVNTFIDDLFAFIIRMPTMARMSCFRDDVVFIIYLWQRYLYPVDTSRPVEGGGVGDVQVASAVVEGEKEQAEKKKQ